MATALLFAGQGAQSVGMGKSLHDSSKAAKALYAEATGVLGWDLAKVSFEGPEPELTETRVCQPALFVHGLALLAALREKGMLPRVDMALGLSLGELTAYAAAGVFDFPTGLRIVAERGRLMQEACEKSAGAMAAVIGEREAATRLCLEFGVEPANYNAPGQTIISGEKARIDAAAAAAKERGKKVILLNVAGAYHSRLMAGASAAYANVLRDVPFQAPRGIVFTNVTGRSVSEPAEMKEALVKQIVSPVLWEDCQRAAAALGVAVFYECGPGAVLAGFAKRIDRAIVVKPACEWADVQAE